MDYDVPSALALNLDQTAHSYVSPGKYTFSSKGEKNVPIKGLDDKHQNDSITKGFNAAGINKAIICENDVFKRVEKSLNEQRQQQNFY